MKLVSGDMLWTSIERVPEKYNYLSEDIECDFLIIGGGVTGAITAYYLTKAGFNTVLVEKNIIGYGSTRASTAILQYEIDSDLIGLSGIVGEDRAVQAFKLCEKAVYDIESILKELDDNCDFRLKDCLYYTDSSTESSLMRREFELRKSYGFDVEFLSKEEGEKRFSFPIEAGIYSKSGVAEINPYKFAHSLIKKAVNNGLIVFENTEIEDINPKNSYVDLKTTNSFKIKANKVVITTGYQAKRYINKRVGIFSRTFTIVTKPVDNFSGWYKNAIIRDNKDQYNYLRATVDNRMIFGGEDQELSEDNIDITNISNESDVAQDKYNTLLDKLKFYFPQIENIEIEYGFNGVFAVTYDGLPRIGGYEGMPNCYFSLGYGSNGILYSIIGGELLRDYFMGNAREELEMFRVDR